MWHSTDTFVRTPNPGWSWIAPFTPTGKLIVLYRLCTFGPYPYMLGWIFPLWSETYNVQFMQWLPQTQNSQAASILPQQYPKPYIFVIAKTYYPICTMIAPNYSFLHILAISSNIQQYPCRTKRLKILKLHPAFQSKNLATNCHAWQYPEPQIFVMAVAIKAYYKQFWHILSNFCSSYLVNFDKRIEQVKR